MLNVFADVKVSETENRAIKVLLSATTSILGPLSRGHQCTLSPRAASQARLYGRQNFLFGQVYYYGTVDTRCKQRFETQIYKGVMLTHKTKIAQNICFKDSYTSQRLFLNLYLRRAFNKQKLFYHFVALFEQIISPP